MNTLSAIHKLMLHTDSMKKKLKYRKRHYERSY